MEYFQISTCDDCFTVIALRQLHITVKVAIQQVLSEPDAPGFGITVTVFTVSSLLLLWFTVKVAIRAGLA